MSDSEDALNSILKKLYIVGWITLALSAVLLLISILSYNPDAKDSEITMVVWLTLARVVGIISFLIGLVAIFNRSWTTGTLLLFGSVALPTFSLLFHGSV